MRSPVSVGMNPRAARAPQHYFISVGAFPLRFRTPKRLEDASALRGSEYPSEGGNLSEVSRMFAGIEHAGDDLDGHLLENPLPFVQKPPSMRIDRPHLVNVLPGDRYGGSLPRRRSPAPDQECEGVTLATVCSSSLRMVLPHMQLRQLQPRKTCLRSL